MPQSIKPTKSATQAKSVSDYPKLNNKLKSLAVKDKTKKSWRPDTPLPPTPNVADNTYVRKPIVKNK